jgi:N-acetylglucosamine-6-phosphate deacetylase
LQSQVYIEGLHYKNGKPIRITIKDGKIETISTLKSLNSVNTYYTIAPGLFDNQVNGFAGVSFALGNHDLSAEGIEKATTELWKKGITSYLPTLTTHSKEVLINNFSILANAINSEKLAGSIVGFHLEGPYINAEDGYRGAHPRQYVRLPDWNEFMELYEASGKNIKEITLAPELPGAIEFIKKSTALGITVAIGHHNANKTQIDEAVQSGAKIATHLGNGCANMIHRHHNPLWPQLANDDLMISIICDGFHLLPEEISTFYKTKGVHKTIITSDVTSYAALPPGMYKTQTGEDIELTEEGKLHYPAQQIMYGSAAPLTNGIGNIMKYTSCSIADAIQMASTNVAKLYNLKDRGELKKGMRADIILFSLKNSKVHIHQTYVKGKLVYDASK